MKKITFLIIAFIAITTYGQNKLTYSSEEYFDGVEWIESFRSTYTYDENDNLQEITYSDWDWHLSEWVSNSSETFTYNEDDKILSETYEYFGENGYGYRTTYTYNSNGNIITQLDEELEDSSWVLSFKMEFHYTDNVLTTADATEWDGANWVIGEDSGFYSVVYNESGTVKYLMNESDWNEELSVWESKGRAAYTYDPSGRILSEINEQWDGTDWIGSDEKQEYEYDTNGNRISSKELIYENGEWIVDEETTSSFDTSKIMSAYIHPFVLTDLDMLIEGNPYVNKILSMEGTEGFERTVHHYSDDVMAEIEPMLTHSTNEYFNGDTWISIDNSKTVYTYDENKNLLQENSVTWTGFGWYSDSKTIYTYNPNNKKLTETYESQGEIEYETTYTYDSNGRLTLESNDNWYEGNLERSKYEFTYTDNKISSAVGYEWVEEDWVESELVTMQYGEDGNLDYMLNKYGWNGSTWETEDRNARVYNENGKIVFDEDEEWDGTSWGPSGYKSEYVYDANGNLISNKDSYQEDGEWTVESEEFFNFDSSHLMTEYAHPFALTDIDILFGRDPYVNKLISSVDGDWRTVYHYNDGLSVSENSRYIDVKVYPNPTTDFITIGEIDATVDKVEVFSLLGKKVKTTEETHFSIKEFSNGVYIVKIYTDGGQFFTTKIVKE